MKIHELKPIRGSRKRRKIIGRGEGSGHGGSATRGTKGQGSRSGSSIMVGFEGGQMPLARRIPKRGFSRRRLHVTYHPVNLATLQEHFNDNDQINPEILIQKKIAYKNLPVKILADGELTKPLQITVHAFSAAAEEKIKKAGGTITKVSSVKYPVSSNKENDKESTEG
ncbi:MAG: 50S ribosomal protein L15 [bacterium]